MCQRLDYLECGFKCQVVEHGFKWPWWSAGSSALSDEAAAVVDWLFTPSHRGQLLNIVYYFSEVGSST